MFGFNDIDKFKIVSFGHNPFKLSIHILSINLKS